MGEVIGIDVDRSSYTSKFGINGLTGEVIIDRINNEKSKDHLDKPTESGSTESNNKQVIDKVVRTITEKFIEGTVKLLPSPYIRAKRVIVITNVGKMFDGKYYIKSVSHSLSASGYEVSAEVLRIESSVGNSTPIAREGAIALPEAVSPETPKLSTITIHRGDTLWRLAKKYNTTIAYLVEVNGIANPDLIYAGAKLKVPSQGGQ